MVVTRSGGAQEVGDKLDKILEVVNQLNGRVSELERSMSIQQQTISTISNQARGFLNGGNVDEACGVDPKEFRSNQLMGEHSKSKQDEGIDSKARRKEKQAFGAKLYAGYIWTFGALMLLSFLGLLPILHFETNYTYEYLLETVTFFKSNMHLPFIFSMIYMFVIFGIQKVMEDREPFDLRKPLALWSLCLGVFSLYGSIRTIPLLFSLIRQHGFSGVICDDTRPEWLLNSDPAGWWTFLFVMSKIPELIDTLFIVLRKRKLITLHWYHHITVMCFCWHCWASHSIYGVFFAAMNLTVHAFMYIFYTLAALGYRPTSFAQSITVIQILQMVAGTAITFYAAFHMTFVEPQDMLSNIFSKKGLDWNLDKGHERNIAPRCFVNPGNALAGMAMYSSYLWLFCVFFYSAYLHKPKTVPVDKKTN